MAGNIQSLNLNTLKEEIRNYYNTVAKLDIYGCTLAIKRMSNYWSGKRMNAIIDAYNGMCDMLYDGVRYFQETILGILGEIYEQYVSMEEGKAKDVAKASVSGVPQMTSATGIKTKIASTSITNIKFDQANVQKEVKVISEAMRTTNSVLPTLVSKLDSMAAYSDSLKKLVTTYQGNARTLTAKLNDLDALLLKQVECAVNVVTTTEGNYNENDVKRA